MEHNRKNFEEEIECSREEKLYKRLPLIIREIIIDSTLPLPTNKIYVEKEIEEIKKITNAECESALEYLNKINQSFKDQAVD